ncbi:MAG TPA: prephenate dehydrogenase/arogenate dehydrogenase family protein [Agitococcus sp.]|nr:prephenate dehydrogenase/arogenate dehydrogenase family protein [Agitococcus sp.]
MQLHNPHNYLPITFQPNAIGIIGGTGLMGQMLARMYKEQGYEVMVTGEECLHGASKKALITLNRKTIKYCDVIIIAVPISELEKGWSAIFGSNKTRGLRHKLIIDVASTKIKTLDVLSQIKGASIIGTHPMFGPTADTKGQNVILCPVIPQNPVLKARLYKCLEWLSHSWQQAGSHVQTMSAEEHDRLASIQQIGVLLPVLEHAHLVINNEYSSQHLQQLSTPNSKIMADRVRHMLRPERRHLHVYAQILASNQFSLQVIDEMISVLADLKEALTLNSVENLTDLLMQTALK